MGNNLTLGFTTIEDLLIKNCITKSTDSTQIKEMEIIIPPYQRPYKWSTKNANQLLDDIELAMAENKEMYRVGTLILYKNPQSQFEIVDGQQRSITFSLLLTALGEKGINLLEQNVSNNKHNRFNIINNFNAYLRRFGNAQEDSEKKRHQKDLKEYIKTQCQLIVVITTDLSEAFQFFDSQNARGKSLYPHDLLKAYHLREMNHLGAIEIEQIVKMWENLDQSKLSILFNDYLYRTKQWVRGKRSTELSEQNIDMFKGVASKDKHPYAQYYKGAFAFAEEFNQSYVPFVTSTQKMTPFQIDAPIIAGKPFFEYSKHYFDILDDIQNNSKYEGYFINDNEIVKTLDKYYKSRTGDKITRLLFDTAILLYVDRFCPSIPSRNDLDYLDQFIEYIFIWAYSLRAQYANVGWQIAQNYIMGNAKKTNVVNDFNVYKIIAEADSPGLLLSRLAERLSPLVVVDDSKNEMDIQDNEKIYKNYLYYFSYFKYL